MRDLLKQARRALEIVRFCVPPAQRPTVNQTIDALDAALAEPEGEDIQIDEWNGLTDKVKVELVRAAPKLTVLELIELVEEELRIKNK